MDLNQLFARLDQNPNVDHWKVQRETRGDKKGNSCTVRANGKRWTVYGRSVLHVVERALSRIATESAPASGSVEKSKAAPALRFVTPAASYNDPPRDEIDPIAEGYGEGTIPRSDGYR